MNTIQLSQRLGRHLDVADPANLPGAVALDVLAAINGGLQQLYRKLPPRFRRATLSRTLRAPATVSLTMSAQYSRTTTANVFTESQIGCTVRIPGSAGDNVVAGVDSVLDEYLGETLTQSATVYSDVTPIQDVIEEVASDVRLYGVPSNNRRTILIRDELLTGRNCQDSEIGTPTHYNFDSGGVSQGGDPEFFLRVHPFPDADYIIRFEALLAARRITFAELCAVTTVPVPDSLVEDVFVPLCEAKLTTSMFWRDGKSINRILDQSATAFENMMIQPDLGIPNRTVGTPEGF